MRVLAVDVGTVRVGLAVSDELGVLATPLAAYQRTASIRKDARAVAETASRLDVVEIIVGLPIGQQGQMGASVEMANQFAQRIGRYTKIPIRMWDERLSTFEAAFRLLEAGVNSRKAKNLIDSQAAAVMLEEYLTALAKEAASPNDAS